MAHSTDDNPQAVGSEVLLTAFRAILVALVSSTDEKSTDLLQQASKTIAGTEALSSIPSDTDIRAAADAARFAALSARSPAHSASYAFRSLKSASKTASNHIERGEHFKAFTGNNKNSSSTWPFERTLWPSGTNSVSQVEHWRSFRDQPNSPWQFWIKWYQGFWEGKPLEWELQSRILFIDERFWLKGPEAVSEEISRIEAEWLAEQLPQADEVSFDHNEGLFVSHQVPLNAVALVETTLKQVEFARSVAAKSNCGFNSNSTSWMYIEFTLGSCRDDANAIEQNLEIARQDIIEGLKDSTYQPDAKLAALEQVLDRAVTDLRANHPDVAAAWEVRIKHKLKLAKADQKQLIVEKATELIAVSQEKLGSELKLDAKTISETSGEVQGGAIQRFFGRVAQMRIVIRSSEVVKRIDASSGYKGTRIVQTLQSLIDLIVGVWPG